MYNDESVLCAVRTDFKRKKNYLHAIQASEAGKSIGISLSDVAKKQKLLN
jgi:hypothetical protein